MVHRPWKQWSRMEACSNRQQTTSSQNIMEHSGTTVAHQMTVDHVIPKRKGKRDSRKAQKQKKETEKGKNGGYL